MKLNIDNKDMTCYKGVLSFKGYNWEKFNRSVAYLGENNMYWSESENRYTYR